jgi:uncharacterized protein
MQVAKQLSRHLWMLPLCVGCAGGPAAPGRPANEATSATITREGIPRRYTIVPVAAHHQHLIGPTHLAHWYPGPLPRAGLPPVLDSVVRERQTLIGTSGRADVFANNVRLVVAEGAIEGADAVRRWWGAQVPPTGMVRYVLPVLFELGDASGHVAGILVQHHPDSTTRYARRLMHVLTFVEKGADGKWRITAESAISLDPGGLVQNVDTVPAARLVDEMNDGGIARGIVLSMAYQIAEGLVEQPDERALVQAENDWTVRQVNAFPDRLVAFCSVNPLRDYSIEEMDRCARLPLVRGMKLHFCCTVDLMSPAHLEKLRHFFRAANERRMPLIVHLASTSAFDARYTRTFLNEVLPVAPDIPIQIAHMAGGEEFSLGRHDEALKLLADAIAAGNPATKNLYFDVTGSVSAGTPAAALDTLAVRMRTIGLHRILFGSDLPFAPLEAVGPSWATFRRVMPLADDEIRVIANNVAPYAR